MNGTTSRMSSVTEKRLGTETTSSEDRRSRENPFVIAQCRRNTENVTLNQNSTTNNETEESDVEEKILAVYHRAGKLGAAYYTLQTGELFILDEIVDRGPEYRVFMSLYQQVDPVRVLLDGKGQGGFVTAVKKTVFAGTDEARCRLVLMSAKEYSFEACKRRIYSLSLPYEPENCTEDQRALFLRTALDFNQTQSVHALGALLRYLDLNWSNLAMDMQGRPQFLTLKNISLSDMVSMCWDTYLGLQVFSSASHPSAFKLGARGTNRETISIYYLFNRCASKLGQSRMRVFLQHPTRDVSVLKARQQVIAFFMETRNDSIMRNICSSMRFIKNVQGILAKIKALSAKAYQWKSLYNTIYNAVLICEMCENAGKECEILEKLASSDINKLYEMALYMNRIIDFDLSKSEGKFTVKAGVDPELDLKKQTMASLQGLMSETAKAELERLPSQVEECSMVYVPHLGYLLAVSGALDLSNLPGMKFMFQNNNYIHYKSKGCEELDMVIGDTYPEIVSHETRIMMRLTAGLMQHLHTLADVVDKCAELDCLIAISKVCKELSFVRPTLSQSRQLLVRNGWHPLLTSPGGAVTNDIDSNNDRGLVTVLTGPNASGKSVFIKQIGLIVYLAHVGSFVPAEAATIGLVSQIHSRIQSTECVANHMSAFLIDLRQMSVSIRSSDAQSLVLVDEFGTGTCPADGAALLAACLNTLLWRDTCPMVLVATHVLTLPRYIMDTTKVRFLKFEYVIQDGAPVFVYKCTEGAADGCYAHDVANASGVPTHVVKRAKDVMACVMDNELPPANKKIITKLKNLAEIIKTDLLAEDI